MNRYTETHNEKGETYDCVEFWKVTIDIEADEEPVLVSLVVLPMAKMNPWSSGGGSAAAH